MNKAYCIRNRALQTFRAECSIKSAYRWCLTGTLIYNSLDDYGALLRFLRTPNFNEKGTFNHYITKAVQGMKQAGFSTLQTLVRTTCLRRTEQSIAITLKLPLREERIEHVCLHLQDQELYDFFKDRTAAVASGASRTFAAASLDSNHKDNVLSSLNFLRLICNHGQDLLPKSAVEIWNARDRTMTDFNEGTIKTSDTSARTSSTKVESLINNLRPTLAPMHSQGQCLPVKRCSPWVYVHREQC